MDNLQIITHSFTPANVDFNYTEIADRLDVVLDKYKGLVFTEDTVKDCKKTMAELRKGQRSLDEFRKETKKKLTLSVAEFEKDCKQLYSKFDEVIDPLKEQADYYEVSRQEDKRIEVQGLIDNIIEIRELDEKRASGMILYDKYILASTSIKNIEESLEEQARILKEYQDQEELDLQFIKETVDQANKDNDLTLLADNYIRLLEVMDLSRVISNIYRDSSKLVGEREIERIRLQKIEERRLREEIEIENARLAKEESDRLIEELEETEMTEVVEEETSIDDQIIYNEIQFNDLPQMPTMITKRYSISGNQSQFKDLETFISAIFPEWTEIDE